LALWQANYTQSELAKLGHTSELIIIETKGDAIQDLSFDKIEGKGFFTKEIEDALLNNEIDIAVHSHKDLPTESPDGLMIAAVSYRENPADVILINKASYDAKMPLFVKANAVIGTSSPRRKEQIKLYRTDVTIEDLRGNVPTRLQKLLDNKYDAIVLAAAGLGRLQLDLTGVVSIELSVDKFIPAPAQGVLAWQIRANDQNLKNICKLLNNTEVATNIAVERVLLNKLEGGCSIACGVYCKMINNHFHTYSFYKNEATKQVIRYSSMNETGDAAVATHYQILKQNLTSKSVFISSDLDNNSYFQNAATQNNFKVNSMSLLEFASKKANLPDAYDAIYFTSKKGVLYFMEQYPNACKGKLIGCFGTETQLLLRGYTIESVILNLDYLNHLHLFKNLKIVFPQARNSLQNTQKAFVDIAETLDMIVYDNVMKTNIEIAEHDIALLTSPMNVAAYFSQKQRAKNYIAIGSTTAQAIQANGVQQVTQCTSPAEEHWVDAMMSI
jgi:hydroxymethylbilane synthase